MSRDLPIWIIEPDLREKRRASARDLLNPVQKAAPLPEPEPFSVGSLKQRLWKVREYARDNLNTLMEGLQSNLSQRYPEIRTKVAIDGTEAIRYLAEIADGTNTISINNSSIVTQELRQGLRAAGFTVINSYLDEFDVEERKILDYWDLPRLDEKNLSETFDVSIRMSGIDNPPRPDRKKYMAVLGINAISAEDTTAFFLEHFSNIDKDLARAEKVAIVVGLDKIVKSREDAAFQTKCAGIFGIESVLLGIQPRLEKTPSITDLPLPPSDTEQELHLIILDNGRAKLREGEFRDLFLCIGCRACNRHCPIRHSFTEVDYIWTPRNYLNQFLSNKAASIDVCLHCEACRIECPIDIDLPGLMWHAKADHITKHGVSFKHRILGMPETLARAGTALAPLANWMMSIKLVRIPMEFVTGIDRNTNLPAFHFRTFKNGSGNMPVAKKIHEPRRSHFPEISPRDLIANRKVAYFTGCFNNYYYPEVGHAIVAVLHKNGVEVVVPEQVCCALPMMAKGNIRGAYRNMEYNTKVLSRLVSDGYALITTCSSCGLMIRRDYPLRLSSEEAKGVAENSYHITEYLLMLHERGMLNTGFHPLCQTVFYHTPCHLRAQDVDRPTVRLLQLIEGITVKYISEVCCGMGGAYGYEKVNYKLSKAIAGRLYHEIGENPADRIVTDCGGCKLQIESGTGIRVDHPLILIREAYASQQLPR